MSVTGQETIIRGSRSSERLIGILCIDLDPGSRESLERLVAQTPGAHVVDNVDRHISPREVKRLLDQFQHRICVIDFDDGEDSARVSRKLREECDSSVSLVCRLQRFSSRPDYRCHARWMLGIPHQTVSFRSGCPGFRSNPIHSSGKDAWTKGKGCYPDGRQGWGGRDLFGGASGNEFGPEAPQASSARRSASRARRNFTVSWIGAPSI